jgi:hypothetical protein
MSVKEVLYQNFLEQESLMPQATPEDTTNPKDRLGINKPNVNLIPPASIIYQALAMQYGAITKGYGPFNWRDKKVKGSIYVAAALRHIFQYLDGQDIDEESGYPALGHAIASLGILVDALENGNLIDDRPPKGPTSKILAQYTKKKVQ